MNVALAQILTGLGMAAIVLGIVIPVRRRRPPLAPAPQPVPAPPASEPVRADGEQQVDEPDEQRGSEGEAGDDVPVADA